MNKYLEKIARVKSLKNMATRSSSQTAEKIIDTASNINDAHNAYKTSKQKYRKLKKHYG